MQKVQRSFGKILPRTADESQVGLLIKDFDHAVELLAQLVKSTKAWQQAWKDILDSQERLLVAFVTTAAPILGAQEDTYNGPVAVETPAHVTRRLERLRHEYHALREELEPDLKSVDSLIVGPAHQTIDSMAVMKKTIKTRENCKLDYERYQSRRDTAFNKQNRSERDNMMLAKHESDLQIAKETYDRADHALRRALPGLLNAVYSLLPNLLGSLIRTAHALIASYYTTIHEFCSAERFPAPSPPMADVISQWAESCKPIQSQIESMASCTTVKRGRLGGFGAAAPRVVSGNASAASISPRISPARDDTSSTYARETISRVSSNNLSAPSHGFRPPPSPSGSDFLTPTTAKPEYFGRDRLPSSSSASSVASGFMAASIVAGKKKPPPPPPKRMGSSKPPEIWVTALYDFGGQNQGDLRMREGDKIKVLKKTESTNDWWEGECNGMRGTFPANYCQV